MQQNVVIYQQPGGQQNPVYQQPMVALPMPQVVEVQQVNSLPTECTDRFPEQFYCTTCQKTYVSRIETVWGCGSCAWCLACSFSVILSFLPCCVDGLRDVVHYCPECDKEVGVYRFMCDC